VADKHHVRFHAKSGQTLPQEDLRVATKEHEKIFPRKIFDFRSCVLLYVSSRSGVYRSRFYRLKAVRILGHHHLKPCPVSGFTRLLDGDTGNIEDLLG